MFLAIALSAGVGLNRSRPTDRALPSMEHRWVYRNLLPTDFCAARAQLIAFASCSMGGCQEGRGGSHGTRAISGGGEFDAIRMNPLRVFCGLYSSGAWWNYHREERGCDDISMGTGSMNDYGSLPSGAQTLCDIVPESFT